MYYSRKCTYCNKVFYTFSDNKEQAASILYNGIKQHLTEYDEDRREYELDDGPKTDTDQIYYEAAESEDPPTGGFEI